MNTAQVAQYLRANWNVKFMNVSDLFLKIKADLPNFPDQIIEIWLVPLAEDGYGWPPNPIGLGEWRYALLRKSLDFWRKSRWDLSELPLEFRDFSSSSKNAIGGLIETNVQGIRNDFSSLVNTKERFETMHRYIEEHGTFPTPVIVKQSDQVISIIDGNHRIAALSYIRLVWESESHKKILEHKGANPPNRLHAAWVMTAPAEGEYEPDPMTQLLR